MSVISQYGRVENAVVLAFADEVYIRRRMKLYSIADAVYIHFSRVCIDCLRTIHQLYWISKLSQREIQMFI